MERVNRFLVDFFAHSKKSAFSVFQRRCMKSKFGCVLFWWCRFTTHCLSGIMILELYFLVDIFWWLVSFDFINLAQCIITSHGKCTRYSCIYIQPIFAIFRMFYDN